MRALKSRVCGILVLSASLSLAELGFASAAHAGGGSFSGGVHNFCVSVRFNASATQLTQIRTAIGNGSQILADATDGQHRFGTVTIVNDSGASQSAEYWINSGSGRAYATYGKYGTRGEHVNLYFDSNFQASFGADGDAYTVAHEHAHHSYGVADEYSGPAGNAECSSSADNATLNYSLMDNYFTRGGRAVSATYTLNEFCTAANHDPDHDTYQQSMRGQSAWQTLAAHATRAATAPAGLPVDAPPAAHSVTFKDGIGGLRVMLLIDRSGSMSTDNRLEFAKLGAQQFTATLSNGDGIGVASLSTDATVDYPLTQITTPSVVAGANAAVNALSASGSTNIGGELLTALGQLTAQPQRSCNELIVLLSDGDHNTGTAPGTALPQLQQQNVTVMTVGVGAGISTAGEATLQLLAERTGGRYFRVADSPTLVVGRTHRLLSARTQPATHSLPITPQLDHGRSGRHAGSAADDWRKASETERTTGSC